MNENGRISRREKNRLSHDLRRNVLLKNFLREQMSSFTIQSSTEQQQIVNSETLNPDIESSPEEMVVDIEDEVNINQAGNANDILLKCVTNEEENNNDIEENNENKENPEVTMEPKSSWKNTLTINFSKITEIKLSHLNPVKRKSIPLTDEDIKLITKKNKNQVNKSLHMDSEFVSSNDENNGIMKNKCNKFSKTINDDSDLQFKPFRSKYKIINVPRKKHGIVKAKHIVKTRKVVDNDACGQSFKTFKKQVKKCFTLVQDLVGYNPKRTPTDVHYEFNDNEQENNQMELSFMINTKVVNNFESENIMRRPQLNNYDLRLRQNRFMKKERSISNSASVSCISKDLSWSLQQIRKLEKANKRLQEENKLLSESLSNIMSDVECSFNSYERPLKSRFHDSAVSCRSSQNSEIWSPSYPKYDHDNCFLAPKAGKAKVLRTRSMQDQAERRREVRRHLSSKNVSHYPYARFPSRTLFRAKPCVVTPCSTSPDEFITNYNYSKGLNRRSSMPEQSRPMVTRRSSYAYNSTPISHSRQSLLSLPPEAFY